MTCQEALERVSDVWWTPLLTPRKLASGLLNRASFSRMLSPDSTVRFTWLDPRGLVPLLLGVLHCGRQLGQQQADEQRRVRAAAVKFFSLGRAPFRRPGGSRQVLPARAAAEL